MAKWRYSTATSEILGWGFLPNGFGANELSDDVVSEDMSAIVAERLTIEKITRMGDGTKPYRNAVNDYTFA